MNRRELFKSVVGIAAASGVTVKASTFDGSSEKPALVIFESDCLLTNDACARIAGYWKIASSGTPFEGIKAIVLNDGLRLTMLDAKGTVINRTVEPDA